jgi:hypothetical protein
MAVALDIHVQHGGVMHEAVDGGESQERGHERECGLPAEHISSTPRADGIAAAQKLSTRCQTITFGKLPYSS